MGCVVWSAGSTKRIERLRMSLHKAIEENLHSEVLKISKMLDKEILRFINHQREKNLVFRDIKL